ncbi:zinc-binding dehydrogenase [Rhodonellum sp.]|uniref:quinone oxidoreductase family protein n=1 Tax=Rhodonellum sp. TaxID=2231180 RepID=UPI0027289F77|nr:zinc-binding dehydrogenase [Rhodonellum sp.]MDO9552828.1 zinc-binding dehydrogenase [Rhodonellum sp.]
MKAIFYNSSLPEKIQLSEIQLPGIGENEVRVRLVAAALNHRDEWCRQGLYPGLKDGVILGSDGAGVVDAIGANVDSNLLGKEVIINPALHWGDNQKAQSKEFKIIGMPDHGTLAEFVQVPSDRIHPKPEHLSWEEAAALPLGGVTAYRAVVYQGKVAAGEKVLVTGFGGGVAQFAVQFALALGAEVYVSSSSEAKIDKAIGMGVTAGFDYKDENWTEEALTLTGGFDLIIDSAMGNTLSQLIKAARPGGKIVLYGATKGNPGVLDARKVFWNQIQIIGTTMGSDQDFANMLALVNASKIIPIVDQIFPLEDAVLAFDKMKAGLQLGKIVVKIASAKE